MTQQTVLTQPEQKVRLFNRNFYFLWQGLTVSRLGDQMYQIAMMLWIKQVTDSATIVGLILMLSSIPALLLGPIGGTAADRYSRRTILIICDATMAVFMLLLGAQVLFFPEETGITIFWLCAIALVNGVIEAFFAPAVTSAVPDLVPKERLSAGNSLVQFSIQAAVFFGQGLGGTLYRILGAPVLFLFTGFSYLFASANDSLLRIPQTIRTSHASFKEHLKLFQVDLVDGMRYIWKKAGLKQLVLVSAVINFFSVPIIMLLPFFVEDTLKAPVDWYGYLIAGYGVGSMLGYLFAGMLSLSGKQRSIIFISLILVQAAGSALLGIAGNEIVAMAVIVLGGLLNGLVAIQVTTLLQETTPSEIRGRIFGLLGTISGAITPIAMGLSGVIADLLDQNIRLIYVGSGMITVACIILLSFNKDLWIYLSGETEQRVAVPAQDQS